MEGRPGLEQSNGEGQTRPGSSRGRRDRQTDLRGAATPPRVSMTTASAHAPQGPGPGREDAGRASKSGLHRVPLCAGAADVSASGPRVEIEEAEKKQGA